MKFLIKSTQLHYNAHIKCFKVTPYNYHDKVLLDFDQIIPIKDADDYTIKIATKTQNETQSAEASRIRYTKRQNFWAEFIEYNKSHSGLFSTSAGTTDSWLGKSIKGFSGVNINICIYNSSTRSEVYINTGDKDKNKQIFDYLLSNKDEIELLFGEELVWQRLDDKVTCRIRIDRDDLSYLNPEHHESIFAFFVDTTNRIMKAFSPFAKNILKSRLREHYSICATYLSKCVAFLYRYPIAKQIRLVPKFRRPLYCRGIC